jgi:ubiquinone/menaquinone biosynthesis C-methylase UbiE
MYENLGSTPLAVNGIRPGGLELTKRAIALNPFIPGSPVLDIGCGNGVTLDYLQNVKRLKPIGIDLSSVLALEAHTRNPFLPILIGNAEKLPFCDNMFEGVILECTLSLIEDRLTALNECRRILRPFGKVIISDLYARNPVGIPGLRKLPSDCCLRRATDSSELKELVQTAGFDVDIWEDQSDLLKEFTFRILWSYGSMENFWGLTKETIENHEEMSQAIRESRPGYFLLVGHKRAQN